MNRLLLIPLFMVGLGVVGGSWGGWWLGGSRGRWWYYICSA